MDIAAVEKAIYDRAKADTGAGGLFASGANLVSDIWNTRAESDESLPFLTFELVASTSDDTLDGAIRQVDVDFHVLVKMQDDAIADTSLRGGQILQRLEGDWTAQVSGLPTFGFDRHILTLSGSNWTAGMMTQVDTTTAHEDFVWHWVDSYTLQVSRAGA